MSSIRLKNEIVVLKQHGQQVMEVVSAKRHFSTGSIAYSSGAVQLLMGWSSRSEEI